MEERIKAFISLVDKMRISQKNFFSTKGSSHLKESKALEVQVDKTIEQLKKELGITSATTKQRTFF